MRPRGISVIDARPPHTETGLAGRPLHGEPPKMRPGLDPGVVAERLVHAIEHDERDVPASASRRSSAPQAPATSLYELAAASRPRIATRARSSGVDSRLIT